MSLSSRYLMPLNHLLHFRFQSVFLIWMTCRAFIFMKFKNISSIRSTIIANKSFNCSHHNWFFICILYLLSCPVQFIFLSTYNDNSHRSYANQEKIPISNLRDERAKERNTNASTKETKIQCIPFKNKQKKKFQRK